MTKKRTRVVKDEDVETEEKTDVEDDSPLLKRKQRRTNDEEGEEESKGGEDDEYVGEEQEDEDDDENEVDMMKMEQEVVGDDEEEGEEEYSDSDGEDRKRGFGGEDKQTEAGIISSINCKHFMCHKNLTVNLNRNINFINGTNGSGKSAILAALQICLGARASTTHRAKSMEGLIRNGYAGDAVLEVTLLNAEDGFQYNEYGDTITVRKTIRRGGGGAYELLDCNGRVVSKERKDLDAMLDYFNIQVENPCCVLDQESSKKFLQGSDKDKYSFFLKATELERIHAETLATNVSIAHSTQGAKNIQTKVPLAADYITVLQREMHEHDQLAKRETKLREHKVMFMWLDYRIAVDKVAVVQREISRFGGFLEKLDKRLEESTEKSAAHSKEVAELKEKMTSHAATVRELKEEVGACGQALVAASKPGEALTSDKEDILASIAEHKAEKRGYRIKIDEARREAIRRAKSTEQQQLVANLQRVETTLQNNAAQLAKCEMELNAVSAHGPQLQERLNGVGGRYQQMQNDLKEEEMSLKYIREEFGGGGNGGLAALGKDYQSQVNAVGRNAKRFQKVPIPVGLRVKVNPQHKDYASCAEGCIGNTLRSFVVTDHRDKNTLMAVLRETKCPGKANVFVQRDRPRYQVVQMPSDLVTTVADVLAVEDDVVYNMLVDQSKIDITAVFPSKQTAMETLLPGQQSGRYKFLHGVLTVIYPTNRNCNVFKVVNGNASTTTGIQKGRLCLGMDLRTIIQQREARIAALREEFDPVQNEYTEIQHQLDFSKRQYEALRRETGQLQSNMRRMHDKREELERKQEDLQMEDNIMDTTELEEQEQAVEKEISKLEASLQECKDKIAQHNADLEPLRRAKDAAKRKWTKAREGNPDNNEYPALLQKIKEEKLKVAKIKASQQGCKEKKADKEKELVQLQANVEAELKTCGAYQAATSKEWDGQPVIVPSTWTSESLQDTIDEMEKAIKKTKKKRGLGSKTREQVDLELKKAVSEYKKLNSGLKRFKSLIAQSREAISERSTKWKVLKRHMMRNTSFFFDEYLQKKGSSGEVKFDSTHKELKIIVQKDANNESTKNDNVQQLSGGERSYSTLALLLAMGAHHEAPFRVMDEFDVFMDAMSRGVAIDQVTQFARDDKHKHRQFIFITPGNLDNVRTATDLKIHRMSDARPAGQKTLNEAWQR